MRKSDIVWLATLVIVFVIAGIGTLSMRCDSQAVLKTGEVVKLSRVVHSKDTVIFCVDGRTIPMDEVKEIRQ